MTRHDPDSRATRRASLRIGWQIMLASAVLVLGIIAVAIIFVVHQAQPREQIDRLESNSPHVYVDSVDLLQGLILIGVGAVVFAGLASWVIARRAVTPLGTALRLQRDFVADASHELRTPLAVLDARIQVLERRLRAQSPPAAAEIAATVAELRSDSRALVDIVGDLLLAAGSDAGGTADPVRVAPVVTAGVDSLRILAAERGVRLHASVDVDETLSARIPPSSLRRCIVALVDNALAHSPDGSTVTVTTARAGTKARIVVADQGAGITGIAPERVFDRFAHTAPQADSNARKGFGIGLALVREIATRQGGRVVVESTSPSGTTMLLELPAAG